MDITKVIKAVKDLNEVDRNKLLNNINISANDFYKLEAPIRYDLNTLIATARYQPCRALIKKADNGIDVIDGIITGLARGKEYSQGELTITTIDRTGNSINVKVSPKDVHRITWDEFTFPKVKRNNLLKVFLHDDKYFIVLEKKHRKLESKTPIAIFRLFNLATARTEDDEKLEYMDTPSSTFDQEFFPIDDNPNDIKEFMFTRNDKKSSIKSGLLNSI